MKSVTRVLLVPGFFCLPAWCPCWLAPAPLPAWGPWSPLNPSTCFPSPSFANPSRPAFAPAVPSLSTVLLAYPPVPAAAAVPRSRSSLPRSCHDPARCSATFPATSLAGVPTLRASRRSSTQETRDRLTIEFAPLLSRAAHTPSARGAHGPPADQTPMAHCGSWW